MEIFIVWIMAATTIMIAAFVLPGVDVNFLSALVVAVVLGFVNAFIRPMVFLITLPVNILTLGLFTFVINALLILLVGVIVPGFQVDGFWWALAFSVVLTFVRWTLFAFK